MATLAQTILDHGLTCSSFFDTDEMESAIHTVIFNSLSGDFARFTLTFDPVRAFQAVVPPKKEATTISQFARLPINPMWLEFPLDEETVRLAMEACPDTPREHHIRRCGFIMSEEDDKPLIIQGQRLNAMILAVYESFNGDIMPFCLYGVSDFSYKHDSGLLRPIGLRWGNPCWHDGRPLTSTQQSAINNTTITIEMALTMINMPRLVVKNEHAPAPKVVKHRAKNGKPPIVSHSVITLNIGPRYSTGQSHAGTGTPRRYHMVTGHIRTLTKGREKPLTTWVPEHARGNIKLGQVIAKERNVKMKGK